MILTLDPKAFEESGFSLRKTERDECLTHYSSSQSKQISIYLIRKNEEASSIRSYILTSDSQNPLECLLFVMKAEEFPTTDLNRLKKSLKNFEIRQSIQQKNELEIIKVFNSQPKNQSDLIHIYETSLQEIESTKQDLNEALPNENMEEIISYAEKAVKKLSIKNFNRNITETRKTIYFAITNLGDSLDTATRTFPIYIEATSYLLIIRVFFSHNSQYHKFNEDTIERYIKPFIAKVNSELDVGFFSLISNRGFIQLYMSYPYTLTRKDTWCKSILNYVKLAVVTYKSFALGFSEIVAKTNSHQQPDICRLAEKGLEKLNEYKEKKRNEIKSHDPDPQSSEVQEDEEEVDESPKDRDLYERYRNSQLRDYFDYDFNGGLETDATTLEKALLNNEFDVDDTDVLTDFFMELYERGIKFKHFPSEHIIYRRYHTPKILIRPRFLSQVLTDGSAITRLQYKRLMTEGFNKYLLDVLPIKSSGISPRDFVPSKEFQYKDLEQEKLRVGSGGFGYIYSNNLHGNPVAIKIPNKKKESDEKSKKRIIREYNIMKQCRHPNVVRSYGLVEYKGKYGLVMELCKKQNLNELYKDKRKSGQFELEDALDHLHQTACGLEFMHLKGISHFDVKPHNVFLGRNNQALIGDFGLSKHICLPDLNLKVGYTLMYCSPEQFTGNISNKHFSCDIWSFGMTMYRILTGNSPYHYIEVDGKELNKKRFKMEIVNRKRLPLIEREFEKKNRKIARVMRDTWVFQDYQEGDGYSVPISEIRTQLHDINNELL